MSDPVIEVDELEKHYPITKGVLRRQVGTVRAVDGISFDIERGETVGLVGESGCGKSTAATSILQLEKPTGGDVRFDGESLLGKTDQELKQFRRNAQIVFQDPESTFDPRMSVGESIAEPLRIHGVSNRKKRRAVAMNLLDRVGMERSDIDRYPHEFSGGQRQRVGIARALALDPEFIVLDEPVSALDVSVQAQILNLLGDLQAEFDLTYLFIAHDLSVVRHISDRVAVMYLGEIAEIGPVEAIFERPSHPYTEALLESVPRANTAERDRDVEALAGDVPSPRDPPAGCRFHTRCPHAREACREEDPKRFDAGTDHEAACFRAVDDHAYWESAPLDPPEERVQATESDLEEQGERAADGPSA